MKVQRVGLAVWVNNLRAARNLRRFGNIHYISKRYKHVCLYVDSDKLDDTITRLQNYRYVTKVEPSYRHEIPIYYSNPIKDKAKEYDYRPR